MWAELLDMGTAVAAIGGECRAAVTGWVEE